MHVRIYSSASLIYFLLRCTANTFFKYIYIFKQIRNNRSNASFSRKIFFSIFYYKMLEKNAGDISSFDTWKEEYTQ